MPVTDSEIIEAGTRGGIQRNRKIIRLMPALDRKRTVRDTHLHRSGRKRTSDLGELAGWIDRGALLGQRICNQPASSLELHSVGCGEDRHMLGRIRERTARPDSTRTARGIVISR